VVRATTPAPPDPPIRRVVAQRVERARRPVFLLASGRAPLLFNATIVDWGMIITGVVITVPTVAFFIAVQRYLIQE